MLIILLFMYRIEHKVICNCVALDYIKLLVVAVFMLFLSILYSRYSMSIISIYSICGQMFVIECSLLFASRVCIFNAPLHILNVMLIISILFKHALALRLLNNNLVLL